MNIIAVDDERPALRMLKKAITTAAPDDSLACFSVAAEALEYAEKNRVDVAFLDINMPGMSGLTLAERLTNINAKTNILFITGYQEYAVDAFSMAASGYIMKPAKPEDIARELSRLRHPIEHLRIGPFTFDHNALKVLRNGEDTQLAPREYALFRLLAESAGSFIETEVIYSRVWGQPSNGDVRTVYDHLSRVRKKLGLSKDIGVELEQQRSLGYRLIVG